MLFVLIQLLPWMLLTVLILLSYLQDRSIEKKHLLWSVSGLMLGFMMSFFNTFIPAILHLPNIYVLKFFDIFHIFAVFSFFLLLTDFEPRKRRMLPLVSGGALLGATLVLVDPTSRIVEGGFLSAAYGRGLFSSIVMLFAMFLWGYIALFFRRYSAQEARLHFKKSTRYFSLACLFAVLSYAAAIIFYVILSIKPAMIVARVLPIVAGFLMYLGARTPRLLASLHVMAEQHQHLDREKQRLQHLSTGASVLDELGHPETLLASVIEQAQQRTGAVAVALSNWQPARHDLEIAHLALQQSRRISRLMEQAHADMRPLVAFALEPDVYQRLIQEKEPVVVENVAVPANWRVVEKQLGIACKVCAPLFIKERFQGTLTFAFGNREYNQAMVNVYTHQCEQILRLLHVLQETRKLSQDLKETNALIQNLHQSQWQRGYTLQDTLRTICSAVLERLNADFAGVWRFENDQYALLAQQSKTSKSIPPATWLAVQASFPQRAFNREFGFAVSHGFPMFDRLGQCMGYLNCAHKSFYPLSPREQEFLKFMSEWTAVEIDREIQTQKLQASEKKYRDLFENALEGIYQISPGGRFLTANAALVKMLGYRDQKELFRIDVGKDLFIDPEERDVLFRILQQEGQVVGKTVHLRHKSGETLIVLASIRTLRDGEGNIRYYEGVFQDLTRLKQLEHQLIRAQKMESIGLLASGVAHDFNNSLSAIQPMAELIRLKSDQPQIVKKCINVILDAAAHSSKLANQLLTLSRDPRLNKVPIKLNHCILAVIPLIEKTLPQDVELQTRLGDNVENILGEVTQIEQLLMNLVLNARDALAHSEKRDGEPGRPKRIQITTELASPPAAWQGTVPAAKSWVRLSVCDNGPGMDPATLDRIFEPFYTTKPAGQGTGLGLAMVYTIVQNHNGLIDVRSEPGNGTCFDLYFPACADAEVAGRAAKQGAMPAGRGHLLVVDDQPRVRESLQQILQALGYKCSTASSGNAALQIYNPEVHDAVLLDLSMPKMDGLQTLTALKQRDRQARVLLMSGFAKGSKIEQALNQGAQGFIKKPFNLSQISAAVYRLMHNDRLAHGKYSHH